MPESSRSLRGLVSVSCFIIVCLMVLPSTVRADQPWYFYYELALKEIKAGQYQRAINNLLKAIEMRPDPSVRARTTGIFTKKYFPYYYLALAYYQTGQYELASKTLQTSFDRGEILRDKETLKEARGLQQLLQAKLQPPKRETPPVTTPATPPDDTRRPETSEPEPERTPESTPPPVSNEPAERVEPSKNTTRATQPPPAESTPTTPRIEEPPRRIPQRVIAGVIRHIENSQYRRAIEMLETALQRVPDDAIGNFLLGFCYSSLYFLEGGNNQDLLNRARLAFRKARNLPPNLKNRLETFVSPKILSLYLESTRS